MQSLDAVVVSTTRSKSMLRAMFDRLVAAREAEVMRRAEVYLKATSFYDSGRQAAADVKACEVRRASLRGMPPVVGPSISPVMLQADPAGKE